MKYSTFSTLVFGTASALAYVPSPSPSWYETPTWTPSKTWEPYPTWTPSNTWTAPPSYHTDCGKDCGGYCGDSIVQGPEECDLGPLNGAPYSGCTKDCKKCGYCGDGKVDYGEDCDLGHLNGEWNSGCSKNCTITPVCGNGIKEDGEECDLGVDQNGAYNSNCSEKCKNCKPPGPDTPPATCATCNPNPFLNKCTITTSCINTPSDNYYCACRAGYRADGLDPTDARQFRLAFPGQEYRVFVAPGVECNTLCTTPFPGPDSCKEVPVQATC